MESHIVEFIQKHFIGIVSTHDGGHPHGTPIFYVYDEDKEVFFFVTKNRTKKYTNLENNKKASLTIFSENPPITFTANCNAELFDFESCDYMKIKNKLVNIHSTQDFYPTPIATLKDGVISLVKLNVIDCNFNSYISSINLLRARAMAD